MLEEIKKIIYLVQNPSTLKTLEAEQRIQKLSLEDGKLEFIYNRNGITPLEKRKIEDQVIEKIKNIISEDLIFIKTVSDNSENVYDRGKDKKNQEKANLKVGHETSLPQKKRIEKIGKIIAISSGKGGVGKSTVSVNLALALKNENKRVGLIDADIYGPSIPMLLGKRDAKPVTNEHKKIIPIDSCGIKFMSFGLFIAENDPVIWRGPMLGGVLKQFLFDVVWGELDYLLVDLPPGTGDVQLSIAQSVEMDGVIGISTPQDVALLDVTKGLKMFEKVKVPILGIVENMSYFIPDDMPSKKYFIFGKGGGMEKSKELKIPFLGEIPFEINLRESCDNGTPYMNNLENKQRKVWESYTDIARKMVGLEKDKKKGIISKILGR